VPYKPMPASKKASALNALMTAMANVRSARKLARTCSNVWML
jgi:hypothetical protein